MTVEIETFSLDDLCDYLYDKVNESVIHTLREQSITGAIFSQLTEEDLKELFPQVGLRLSAAMVLRELKQTATVPASVHQIKPSAESNCKKSTWVDTFELPDRFTSKTMKAMSKGCLARGQRSEIINAVHTRMLQYTECPKPYDYRTACKRLVAKFPSISDVSDCGYGTWKEQLKMKFRNGRRGEKRKLTPDETDKENEPPTSTSVVQEIQNKRKRQPCQEKTVEEGDIAEYLKYLSDLEEEQRKDKPSMASIKRLMKLTFTGRRSWIQKDTPTVGQILSVYPQLRVSSRLRRELTLLVKAEKSRDFLDKWTFWVKKINAYGQVEAGSRAPVRKILEVLDEEVSSEVLSEDAGSVCALRLLSMFLVNRSKHGLIKEFSDTVDLDEEVKTLPPFPQILIVNHNEGRQFFISVEQQVLLESESLRGSVVDLISTYFAFDIQYPRPLYPLLLFLQRFGLGIVDEQCVPNNVMIIVSSLEKL